MSRSNKPLALSVVTLTQPGDVRATFENITAFDDRDFGFNHNQTWAALPLALRGVLDPDAVSSSFTREPMRVQRCIKALCELGKKRPIETRRFADYPEAGLKTVHSIDWDPDVSVRVKASCWYVAGSRARIPILQPRKVRVDDERLSAYVRLAKQAYCHGDWVDAQIDLIDLSGEEAEVAASVIEIESLPAVSDRRLRDFVETFVNAKKLADLERAKRPKKASELPLAELLGFE